MNTKALPVAKFRLGRIVPTPHALEVIPNEDIVTGITRHQAGDWGELKAEELIANDQALVQGTSLRSAYRSAKGVKFWMITEANRSFTRVLLPDDH